MAPPWHHLSALWSVAPPQEGRASSVAPLRWPFRRRLDTNRRAEPAERRLRGRAVTDRGPRPPHSAPPAAPSDLLKTRGGWAWTAAIPMRGGVGARPAPKIRHRCIEASPPQGASLRWCPRSSQRSPRAAPDPRRGQPGARRRRPRRAALRVVRAALRRRIGTCGALLVGGPRVAVLVGCVVEVLGGRRRRGREGGAVARHGRPGRAVGGTWRGAPGAEAEELPRRKLLGGRSAQRTPCGVQSPSWSSRTSGDHIRRLPHTMQDSHRRIRQIPKAPRTRGPDDESGLAPWRGARLSGAPDKSRRPPEVCNYIIAICHPFPPRFEESKHLRRRAMRSCAEALIHWRTVGKCPEFRRMLPPSHLMYRHLRGRRHDTAAADAPMRIDPIACGPHPHRSDAHDRRLCATSPHSSHLGCGRMELFTQSQRADCPNAAFSDGPLKRSPQ